MLDDPFVKLREAGSLRCPFEGEMITMIMRHADVRDAATRWQKYSSDAPFRVPIPSEETVRSVRQLPIETDPPSHRDYRKLTDHFFLRAKLPSVIASVRRLTASIVKDLATRNSFEAVKELALPIQSRALTYLLNVPESEADIWVHWGIQVFQPSAGDFKGGDYLEDYLNSKFDLAQADPGDDFFSHLVTTEFAGRVLTREECLGFANLAFAGGRDTVIHSLTSIAFYLSKCPKALEYLRDDQRRITLATEEFIRVFMPLTQIGRICKEDTELHGNSVKAGERVGLCWASANFDERVFDRPQEIVLDRRPNPHVSFGFRNHLCQGAAHARLVIRSFLEALCSADVGIEVIGAKRNVEQTEAYIRKNGFEELRLRFCNAGTLRD